MSLAIVITSIFILFGIFGVNRIGTRTFIGSQVFNNMEEAQIFQCDIYKEALAIGARIEQNMLIEQSEIRGLPAVYFYIIAPAERYSLLGDEPVPFKYGKASTRFNSITALILASLFLIALLWFIWSRRGQRMFAEAGMWEDGILAFGVLFFPCILLLCSLLYIMQVYILEE